MWIVVLIGLLSDIPTSVFCIALVVETVYPTLGDDDCIVIADDGPVQAMHPGYAGDVLLDAPAQMPPDGLCLYHCIAAAANYASYMALSAPDRAVLAEQLRQKAIATLREHGLSSQAERLSLSGSEGYPDEPDFLYIAMASGTSFEVAGISPGYVPHYGTSSIAARVLFTQVADGAGHVSDHFDLVQIYYDPKPGNGRWRLWRKTTPSQSVYSSLLYYITLD